MVVNVTGDVRLAPQLVKLLARNAYVRQPNTERRKLETTSYKKGWEVRLVLKTEAEVEAAQRIVQDSGLKAGRPFRKARQWILPLYGREAVKLIQQEVDLRKTRA